MKTTPKQPKRNNATSGKKAHNDSKPIRVGRINWNSWAAKVLTAADIYVNETELVHINNYHGKEISTVGMKPLDFVSYIIKNYNEIRKGTDNSFWLVVKREHTSNFAAIELQKILQNKKPVWIIKTASLVSTRKLHTRPLIKSAPTTANI